VADLPCQRQVRADHKYAAVTPKAGVDNLIMVPSAVLLSQHGGRHHDIAVRLEGGAQQGHDLIVAGPGTRTRYPRKRLRIQNQPTHDSNSR
jgi:hypothetical protein